MSNPNYLRGRRFEYLIKKRWSEPPYKAVRTAGSHGEFDIVAYVPRDEDLPEGGEVYLQTREVKGKYEYVTYLTPIKGYGIQCKVRKIKKGGKR